MFTKEELLEQLTLVMDVMSEEKFSDLMAKMLWNIYQSLKKVGFTEEQAIIMTTAFAKNTSNK